MRVRTIAAPGVGLILALASLPAWGQPSVSVTAVEPAEPFYDAGNRRDPFRPPRTSASTVTGEARTPLERYELGQLRLVAIIFDTKDPRAVVEDDSGLGYIVKVGTRIGPNGGSVRGIERGRMIVREEYVDFYGEHHPNDVTMELKVSEKGRGKR